MNPRSIIRIGTALLMLVSLAFAAGTPAGTVISNFATGDYKDVNGNALPQVTSNTVTTTVTQVAGVDIVPPLSSANLLTLESVVYSVEIVNTGNGFDSFSLSEAVLITAGTGSFSADIYHDIDGNGIIDGLDSLVTSTGLIPADGTFNIVIEVTDNTVGGAANNTEVQATLTAESVFNTAVTATHIATSTITAASVTATITADVSNPQPGDVITYAICGLNEGSATAYDVTVSSLIPDNTTYIPGSMRIGASDYATADELSDPDDGVEILPDSSSGFYNSTLPASVTIVWGDAVAAASGCVFYQVVVNEDVPVGTEIVSGASITYNNDEGTPYPEMSVNGPTGSSFISQFYDVTLSGDLSIVHDPGDEVLFPITITNTGNGNDIFDISYTSTFWTWEFYLDTEGNGTVDADDVLLGDTNTDGIIDVGTMTQGAVVYIIARTVVPPGSSDGTADVTVVTATSVGDPAVPAASDAAQITTTVRAPILSLTKTVSPVGNQPPGTELTYTVSIVNSGSGSATEVLIADAIPTNTSYVLNSLYLAGILKTDGLDGDGATHNGNAAVFSIPSLGPGSSTTVSFSVTID